jgi:putative transposase
MTIYLQELGYRVNRKRVQRLMRELGIEALYPKPRLSKANLAHQVYLYLLRDLTIETANQVWCTDITYLPVLRGHFYLVAIMDWYSQKILPWRTSNTLDIDFYIEALQEALDRFGCPCIFNSDQGSQFTSNAFTESLEEKGIRISMHRKGRYLDNMCFQHYP